MRRGVSSLLAAASLLGVLLGVLSGCSQYENRNNAFPELPDSSSATSQPGRASESAPAPGPAGPPSGAPSGGLRVDTIAATELIRRARLAVAAHMGFRILIARDARSGISLVDAAYNPTENSYVATVVSGRFTRLTIRIGPDAWVSASPAYWLSLGLPDAEAEKYGAGYVTASADPGFDEFEVLLEQSAPTFVLDSWDARPEKLPTERVEDQDVIPLRGRSGSGELTVHLSAEEDLTPVRAVFTGAKERTVEYREFGSSKPVFAPWNPVFPG